MREEVYGSRCACAKKSDAEAKTCAPALKKPNLEVTGSWWHGGGLKYTPESFKAHDEIRIIGETCDAKISVGTR